jgi:uncharacterized protein DUF6221
MSVMTDLHDQIRAAVEARRERAQAAGTGSAAEWYRYERYVEAKHPHPQIFDADEEPVLWLAMDGTQAVMDHIAAENPAVVLRHCAEDLDVLERHRSAFDEPQLCWSCFRGDDYLPYPCPEVLSLARRYGIEAS